MNKIAAIICNYNKKDFVINCIKSVLAADFTDFDLIVVDNASTDGSVEAIKEHFGARLTILVNEENLGGSGGFNRGMQYALDKGTYKYLHLLDNDIIIDKNAVGALYDFMENHPETGTCGSLILRMDQPNVIQDYGAMIEIENLGVRPLYHAVIESGDLPEYIECDYVAACSAMYRTSVLAQTGVIDKDFFIYWDDMSLSWEIRLAGYKVNACKNSRVWHAHGLAEPVNTFGIYYFFRNKLYSFIKYSDDRDYENLCENLTKRLFRTFAVNQDNPETVTTYFHALNDALNNIRGKAAPYIIKPVPEVNEKFVRAFGDKKAILLLCDTYDFDFIKLTKKLNKVTSAKITIQNNGHKIPQIEGVEEVVTAVRSDFDAVVRLCPHVLDEKGYNRDFKYIDRYMNQILDEAEFDFVENLAANYAFFHSVFYGFLKDKFDVLRKEYRKGKYRG